MIASVIDQRTVYDQSRYYYLEQQGLNGRDYIGSHLALGCNPVDDLLETLERQRVWDGSALANLLLDQWGNYIDVVFIEETTSGVDHQTGKSIILGEANLQNTKVTL
jgi:hypothetical protein